MSKAGQVTLNSLRLLALVTWLGSLIFCVFVVSRAVFSPAVLTQTHSLLVSGLIFGSTLNSLHWIGLICGVVFILCVWQLHRRLRTAQLVAISAMILLTAFSQFWIIPRMDNDRIQAGGDINSAPYNSPARQDFDRLHPLSEKVEGLVLLAGIVLTVLVAAESTQPHTID